MVSRERGHGLNFSNFSNFIALIADTKNIEPENEKYTDSCIREVTSSPFSEKKDLIFQKRKT